ncbi:MAG TPA: tyrosine-type recombinase/integrase [bacterium]|nr:tyrosine-type recombinase/integrase [bacterium]
MELRISITRDNRPQRAKPWLVRWYGDYDVRTGKQRRYCKSFTLRKDAERFVEEKKAEFQAGLPADQRDITLKQLCRKFMDTRPKAYSKAYRRGLEETIDRLLTYFSAVTSIRRIRIEDAEAFIASLEPTSPQYIAKGKELSDSALALHLRQAKTIFSTAQAWGYLKANPFQKVKLGNLRRREWHFISVEEFNAIIDQTPSLREKALYGVMYWCGLRFGEAANLRWEGRCIDFERGEISVFNRPATKTLPPFRVKDYEARIVPMNTWIMGMLKQLHALRQDHCPYVFLTPERLERVQDRWTTLQKARKSHDWENRFMLNSVLRDFKTRCCRAGIKTDLKLTLHGLRKSWATNLANSGKVPPKTLLELGGWSSIRTCEEFYLKNTDANRQRACQVLNELAGGE